MFGFLNVNKPAGCTSRDVVNQVQRRLRSSPEKRGKRDRIKCGHAGTLDPLATGVLVIGIGHATRLISFVQAQCKEYVGTFQLGKSSDTEDTEGNVVSLPDPLQPTMEQLIKVLPAFVGRIQQMPPVFSALKIRGQRAYELARAGQEVKLQPREVRIDEIQLLRYEYPEMQLRVRCGGGTYIRSLGRDIAEAVGTAAVMSQLTRTAIGPFRLEDSVPSEQIAELTDTDLRSVLKSPALAVKHLPRIDIDDSQQQLLGRGQHLPLNCLPDTVREEVESSEIAAFTEQGTLRAILRLTEDGRSLRSSLQFGIVD